MSSKDKPSTGELFKGKVVILSGPSGVGKTTVCDQLTRRAEFVRVLTATTRAPRPGERDGVDYRFLDEREFRRGLAAGEFLEHATVHGNLYGTPRASVEAALATGRHALLAIDVQGARQVIETAGDLPLVTVFLLPPSDGELRRRLAGRGSETPEQVAVRLETARRELEAQDWYEHRLVNDDLERTVAAVAAIAEGAPPPEGRPARPTE